METMKRKWGKPMTEVQQFAPSEYVAQCITLWSPHKEANGVPGLQSGNILVAPTSQSHPNQQFEAYLNQVNSGYLQGPDTYNQYTILTDDDDTYISQYQSKHVNVQLAGDPVRASTTSAYQENLWKTTSETSEWWVYTDTSGGIWYSGPYDSEALNNHS